MISCGYYHSMALTESGLVISWGHNKCDNLNIETIQGFIKTKSHSQLKDVLIYKISCD